MTTPTYTRQSLDTLDPRYDPDRRSSEPRRPTAREAREANARLIAAAPEMYEALQALVFALNLEGVPHNQAWDELMATCRAALAKGKP